MRLSQAMWTTPTPTLPIQRACEPVHVWPMRQKIDAWCSTQCTDFERHVLCGSRAGANSLYNVPEAHQSPTFHLISCRTNDHSYPWGVCHVMRPTHSDNTYLQCLLLEMGFQDMKAQMRKRHDFFKMQEVRAR